MTPETVTPPAILVGGPVSSGWLPASWARAAASMPMRMAAAKAVTVTARAPRRVRR